MFPVDNYKDEDGIERYEAIKKLNIDEATQMRVHHPNLDEKNKIRVEEYLSRNQDPMELYHKVEEIASMYKNDITTKVSTISVSVYSLYKLVFDAEDFSSAIYVDFENQKFLYL